MYRFLEISGDLDLCFLVSCIAVVDFYQDARASGNTWNPGFTAGRDFNPAGGAPGGG
ncbi:hypothetical protein F511_17200 [Dorcoceras hygrometricum]|uniref:Uncharacterized protein n=1 Tax=Dorcoceras hygrometricum TaxID=472368 RepID=A0A2Z7DAU7_9LAMI|nr:hypothetical protein F511_17200 [Dorcoceras hygrometricum]